MLKAKKDNVVVRIHDEKKPYYMSMGYTIFDEKGNVVYDPLNNKDEVKGLKAAIDKKNAELASKDVEIKNLKEEVTKLKDEIAKRDKTITGLEKSLASADHKAKK